MRTCCATLLVVLITACGHGPDLTGGDEAQEVLGSTPQAPLDRGDGLTVDVVSAGTGAEVTATSEVSVQYRAFVEGVDQPFDANDDSGVPLALKLGATAQPRVIEGLSRGLVGLRVGTRAVLHIPAALGWGATGNAQAGVPADSQLRYEVNVLAAR